MSVLPGNNLGGCRSPGRPMRSHHGSILSRFRDGASTACPSPASTRPRQSSEVIISAEGRQRLGYGHGPAASGQDQRGARRRGLPGVKRQLQQGLRPTMFWCTPARGRAAG